ncbi:MAG: ATP-binding cassette domain-containing protein [Burkholderiales bacterium]|nr:ATP-binding cassette domain-containing protein [Burkholderiales bacterium]
MVVDIRDLKAGYGTKAVVSLASLQIETGEHTLLLGPSGCGKTTLLNVLSGIASTLAGRVVINGTALETLSVGDRDRFRGKHIGLVMQRLHLISALTISKNLRLAQQLAGVSVNDGIILGALEKLGLAAMLDRYPRELSQGEAQRVAIARAVINRPALILADEPTSALDDANCLAAIDLLFDQATAYGATLIVATHDQRIKARFERVVTLEPYL